MPNSKTGQPTRTQVAFPTDQLYAAATNFFKNSDGEPSQMQKAFEVGSYFLSGCMAYEALRSDVCDTYHEPLTLLLQGQHIAVPWYSLVSHQRGLVQCLDSINQAVFRSPHDNPDPILGSNRSQSQWRQKCPRPINPDIYWGIALPLPTKNGAYCQSPGLIAAHAP